MKAYIPSGSEDRQKMLEKIGLSSVDQLFAHLPEQVRAPELQVPDGLSEMELTEFIQTLADENRVFEEIWRGAGAYKHFIPAVVDQIMTKERFLTAYTPYQAEISQGILQSIFEYQTAICELTGMAASNASLYDGASALAESCRMAVHRKKNKILLLGNIHPNVVDTVLSYYPGDEVEIAVYAPDGQEKINPAEIADLIDENTAAIAFQHPNYLGILEDAEELCALAHAKDVLAIMSVNPATLGVLAAPADLGADICVGEAQPLGLPLSYGGPYVGFMATTEKLMRNLPGRIVGETVDAERKRAYVLTLQAREQHIRREKASSNVCTNQALCAMRVNAFLTTVGPDGLRKMGEWSYRNAHTLAEELDKLGFKRTSDLPFFNEFVTTSPLFTMKLEEELEDYGILSGLPLDGHTILWCATECNTDRQLANLVATLKDILEIYGLGVSSTEAEISGQAEASQGKAV